MSHLRGHPVPQTETMAIPVNSCSEAAKVSSDSASSPSTTDDEHAEETNQEAALKDQNIKLKVENLNLRTELARFEEELAAKEQRRKKLKAYTFYEEPFTISFPEDEATYLKSQDRQHTYVPGYFYRAFHETSGTLSCYVSKDCWPSVHPPFKQGAAFQSLNDFLPVRDLTYKTVMRHFNWQQKSPWTSFVSVFNSFWKAELRANFLYKKSKRNPRRISVAQITTKCLVPAFFETTEIILSDKKESEKFKKIVEARSSDIAITDSSAATTSPTDNINAAKTADSALQATRDKAVVPKQTRKVKVPIWIRNTAVPEDRSSITLKQLESSGADTWLSAYENRKSGLLLPERFHGQPEEWLAGGVIPRTFVTKVWPFDGVKVHMKEGDKVVVSSANKDYEFDWIDWIWRSRTEMCKVKDALERKEIEKRKFADSEGEPADDAAPAKRRNLKSRLSPNSARRKAIDNSAPNCDAVPASDDDAIPTPNSI